MKIQEAKRKLINLLEKAGINYKKPNPQVILDVYKEFATTKIDCSRDAFLFQCGVFKFTEKELFYWDFVRQFEIEIYQEEV